MGHQGNQSKVDQCFPFNQIHQVAKRFTFLREGCLRWNGSECFLLNTYSLGLTTDSHGLSPISSLRSGSDFGCHVKKCAVFNSMRFY